MLKRLLAAAFGAIIFGVLVPFLYVVLIGVPESLTVIGLIIAGGVSVGATLGALFPKIFGLIFEAIFEI